MSIVENLSAFENPWTANSFSRFGLPMVTESLPSISICPSSPEWAVITMECASSDSRTMLMMPPWMSVPCPELASSTTAVSFSLLLVSEISWILLSGVLTIWIVEGPEFVSTFLTTYPAPSWRPVVTALSSLNPVIVMLPGSAKMGISPVLRLIVSETPTVMVPFSSAKRPLLLYRFTSPGASDSKSIEIVKFFALIEILPSSSLLLLRMG